MIFAVWRAAGTVEDVPHLIARFDLDGTAFYVVARSISLLAGLATVALVVALGTRLAGRAAGIAAGLVLALSPLHIEMSRFARVDAFMVFWTTLTILLAIRYIEGRRARDALLLALAAGAALATKYPAAFLVAGPLAVAARHAPQDSALLRPAWRRALVFAAVPVAVLLVTSPFILLDARSFLDEARRLALRHVLAADEDSGAVAGPLSYVTALAGRAFGAGFLLAAIVGIFRCARERSLPGRLLLAAGAPYVVFLALAKTPYDRYLLPLVPALALAAGEGAVAAARRLAIPWPAALVFLCLPTAPWVVSGVVIGATSGDTRIEALRFIEAEVPAGSRLLLAGDERRVPPVRRIQAPTLGSRWLARQLETRPDVLRAAREAVAELERSATRPAYRVFPLPTSDLAEAARTVKPAAIVLPDSPGPAAPPELDGAYRVSAAFRPSWRRAGPAILVLVPDQTGG